MSQDLQRIASRTIRIQIARVFLVSFLVLTIDARTHSGTNRGLARGSFRILVVADTGFGDDAFNEAFQVVQGAMVHEEPNLVLHVGDYIYNESNPRGSDAQEVSGILIKTFNGNVYIHLGPETPRKAPEVDDQAGEPDLVRLFSCEPGRRLRKSQSQ